MRPREYEGVWKTLDASSLPDREATLLKRMKKVGGVAELGKRAMGGLVGVQASVFAVERVP